MGKAETFPYVDANVVSGTSLSLSSLTSGHKAASLADSSPASVPLPLRVEPKPKSGIRFSLSLSLHTKNAHFNLCTFLLRLTLSSSLFLLIFVFYLDCRQQDLLKKVVEIKPKRQRGSNPSDGNQSTPASNDSAPKYLKPDSHLKKEKKQPEADQEEKEQPLSRSNKAEEDTNKENPVKSLLGLAYASSDDDED